MKKKRKKRPNLGVTWKKESPNVGVNMREEKWV
jgi:hypothetical protein